MKKQVILTLLATCLALSGCGLRSAPAKEEPTPAPATAAPEVTAEPTAEPVSESPTAVPFDRARYDAAAEALRQEYLELRSAGLDAFDEDAHPQLPWYTAVLASYGWSDLYSGEYDFDENGVPELVIAAGDDEFRQPLGIYAFDGEKMVYLCPQQALGERSTVAFTDGLFFVRASGGAAVGSVTVYRIGPDGYSTELIEVMDYEFTDPETVVYTPELGNMTAEELQSHDYMQGFTVPVEYTLFAEATDGGHADMPNPWSVAKTPEEAAAGAVLDRFVLPEVFGCAEFSQEDRRLTYTDGLAVAVYYNGTDVLEIRKGAGSQNVSGDYNAYAETRTVNFNGLEILCFGQDGQIRLARWEFGGNSYSLAFNTTDLSRPGLTEDQVTFLVNQIG